MSHHTRFRGDAFGCDSACEKRKHFTAETNDRQTLLDRSIYRIYSTAGYRLWLVPHRKTLRPDGVYPTQNIMKRTVRGDDEGGGEAKGD